MTDLPSIAEFIWDQKYRMKKYDGTPVDQSIDDTWRRVAMALSFAEPEGMQGDRYNEFFEVMQAGYFSPAGRIIAGAGTGRNVTLSNCLAAGTLILTSEYGLVPIGEIAGETVTVLDGEGEWVAAPINSFGEQPVASVTLAGGYNGCERKIVCATAGHRWILKNGQEVTTEKLEIGHHLIRAQRKDVSDSMGYLAGIQHGLVYGDGSQRPTGEIKLRLCGAKKDLVSFFEGWKQSSPPSAEGDVCIYGGREMGRERGDLKALPGPGMNAAYLTGFLRGWMATDGCVTRGKALISCGAHEVDWLRRFGSIAGMEVSCATRLGSETNYGTRTKALFNVYFHRWTMIEEDFLLQSHREKFEAAVYPWTVVSVGEFGEPEPVFCPRVTTTNSVQLDLGIHTGQCFTMGTIPDSMDGIFSHLKEAALTMQQGGGIGYDFSTLRPKGAEVTGVAADASGPLTFMDVWDAMCRTVMSAGSRRGAMMATMRCDHPDIEAFIDAKRDPAKLRMFNLSVLVTDAFMQAVAADANWRLHFENRHGKTISEKTVKARELWDKIMRSTYAYAEPGVIFIDRVNEDHNLGYLETIATTNPCGEKPMGPYASCLLGSVNLAKLILDPFTDRARIDYELLRKTVRTAIRMMDNVIEAGQFPLKKHLEKAQQDRQLGLGVTGLADALIMVRRIYGSDMAVQWTEEVMREIAITAYEASVHLAKERGAFPTFNAEEFLSPTRFAGRQLPDWLKQHIRDRGIRNGLLISIAPTGTISLFAGNVSSGIEPVFALTYDRKVLQPDGSHVIQTVEDYAVAAYRRWCEEIGQLDQGDRGIPFSLERLPEYFVTAQTLSPEAHVRMQAAAQRWVDSSISKTVNVPEDISFEDLKEVYQLAYDLGCKGCTTYRPNDVTGSVLSVKEEAKADEPAMQAPGPHKFGNASFHLLDPHGKTLFSGRAAEVTEKFYPLGAGVSYTAVINEPDFMELPRNPDVDHPQDRREELPGATYKLKWPGSDHAIYVTINDVVDPVTLRARPFEIFINSKNMEHYAWTVALTRMVSAIFRRPHDSRFVVEELKAVFDPKGGAWVGGSYVPSVLAAIGGVIEKHMKAIGYIEPKTAAPHSTGLAMPDNTTGLVSEAAQAAVDLDPYKAWASDLNTDRAQIAALGAKAPPNCPTCGSFNMKFENGCPTCLDCGNSKCG
jgi:ribonucleoside-diphosphate reductase alpha chain